MSRTIVKLGDHYLIWSTIVDGPITYGMTQEEVKAWTKEEYGNEGLRDLDARLRRVDETGTSSRLHDNAVKTIWLNHAGPQGSTLTIEGIYRHFCLREPLQEAWIVPAEIVAREDGGHALYAAVTDSWKEKGS